MSLTWCKCPDDHKGPHLKECPEFKEIVIDIYNNPLHGEIFRACLRLANSQFADEIVKLRDQLCLAIGHSNCYCDSCKKLTPMMFTNKIT